MNRSLFSFAAFTALLYAPNFAAHAQPSYSLTPIETEGGGQVVPTDINEKGEVVGAVARGPFLWRNGVMIILPDLSAGSTVNAAANGINNRSDVVGESFSDEFNEIRGFLFRQGEITDIGAPPDAVRVQAEDISNSGVIIGQVSLILDGNFMERGFIRERSGEFLILEPLPEGSFTLTEDINERGDVVGASTTGEGPGRRAVIWRDGTVENLGLLPGFSNAEALAINDRGQVVGDALADGTTFRAFLWDRGELVALPLLGFETNRAADINNRGQIVGEGRDIVGTGAAAILWEKGVAYNLNDLIRDDDPLEPFVNLLFSVSINNRGQIVAIGRDSRTSPPRPFLAYLLTPNP